MTLPASEGKTWRSGWRGQQEEGVGVQWRVWRSDPPVEKKKKEPLEKKKNGGGWGYGERDHTVKG